MRNDSYLQENVRARVVGTVRELADAKAIDYARARRSFSKRVIDIVLSLALLILVSPFMLVVAAMIRFRDGGQVIFAQERPGVGGKLFKCYKFRTMVEDAEQKLQALLASDPVVAEEWRVYKKLRKDPRVTRLGAFLRRTSLDELPQLFNILRGEMSIIGPRPITKGEIPDYGTTADFEIYGSVRPGVLGLWQVSGRSNTNYSRRIALDAEYARDWSLWMDLKIVLQAIPVVLFGKGAY